MHAQSKTLSARQFCVPCFWCMAVSACFIHFACFAHEGPEHEIEELNEQIKTEGHIPDLLVRRAIGYNIVGKFTEAAKDLEVALDLDESLVDARRELSLAYFALGKTNEALATVSQALNWPAAPAEEASVLVTRAGFLRARREYRRALSDVSEAIKKHPHNVEWYLMRSQLQALLDLKKERVRGLDEAMQATGSGLLLGEWVDALIVDGQLDAASKTIDKELEASRWKSAWLIRRAKVDIARGNQEKARKDLEAATEELNLRLSAGAADALLLADRALAYELLGKKAEARRDYRATRDKGLADEWVHDRIRALREED